MPAQDFLKEKNMAKFCPLFSSSSGNCIYIGTSDGGILIDAGVSAKRITGALENIGVSPDSISAIFITHEHSDHINGLRVFAGSKAQHEHKAHENTQNSFFHFYHHSFKNICFNILCAFCAVIIEYIISRTKSRVSPKYERTKYGRAVDF